MIIVKLKYGLGNQLFQYAIGRYLSLIKNTKLKLDISHYNNKDSRKFELPFFSIPSLETNIEEHLEETFYLYKERNFRYDRSFRAIRENTYIDGFWQTEKYFSSIRHILINDLQIRDEYIGSVKKKAVEISKEESVSIHIRRGDYLIPKNFDFFGTLPIEYYLKAIEIVSKKLPDAKLYFFSDDIGWVRKSLVVKNKHEYISGSTAINSIEDFYLMSHCRHHIIANSSFSWWTAWLSTCENKIVIGPLQWFHNAPYNTKDILPKHWIKL